MNKMWKGLLFDKEGGAGGANGDEGDGKKTGGEKPPVEAEVLDWDIWHKALPEDVQTLIADHESGLKTALGSERDARKKAETNLRDVAKKLEDGSAAQKEVLKLADDVAAETVKAEFYEDAHNAGVSNLKLAYHVATTEELFDKRGNVNFEKMKETFPELFGKPAHKPPADAGEGVGTDLSPTASMNAYIRRSAGRQE